MTAKKTAKKKFTATPAMTPTSTSAHAPLTLSDTQGVQSSIQSGATLKYHFPPPSKEIINNIAKSLLDVPELYQNVLNIMNKMALPPPFVKKPASQFNNTSSSKTFAGGSNTSTQPTGLVSMDSDKYVERATKAITPSSSSKTALAMAFAETNSSSKSTKAKARIAPLSLRDQQEEINATAVSCLTASRATTSTSKVSAATGTKSTAAITPPSALSSKNSASLTESPQALLSSTSAAMSSSVPKSAVKTSSNKEKSLKGKKVMLPAGKTPRIQTAMTCSRGQRKRRKQKEKRAAEIVRRLTFGINRFITSPLLSGKSFAFAVADAMKPQLPLEPCGQLLDEKKLQRELLIRNPFLNENFVLETTAHLQQELAKHKSAMATATTPKERADATILMNNTECMIAYHEYNVSQMAEFLKAKNPLKEQLTVKEQTSSAGGAVDIAESASSVSSTPAVAATWNKENVNVAVSAPSNPKLFSIDSAPPSLSPATVIQESTNAAAFRLPSFVVPSIDIAPSSPVVGPSIPPLPAKLATPTKPILRVVSQFDDAIPSSEANVLVPSLAGDLPLKRKANVLSPPSAPDSGAAQNTTAFREACKNEGDPDYVLSSNESSGESKPECDSELGPDLKMESESQPKDNTDANAVNRAQPRQRLSWGVEWIKEIPKDAVLSPELVDTTEKMDTDEESATDPMEVADPIDESQKTKAADVTKGSMAADAAEKIKAAVSAKRGKVADLAMVLKSGDPISEEAFSDIEHPLEQMTKKQKTEIRQILKDHKKDEKKAFWLEVNDPVVPVPLTMIDSNKVPRDNLFSNPKLHYTKSEPSPTLLINNLVTKRVRAQDLANIFSNFFDPPKDIEVKGTIRYMNAGRMRGRAYIYFPNVEKAKEACERVNGYILYGQPMVIMYGNQPQSTQKNIHNATNQGVGTEKR